MDDRQYLGALRAQMSNVCSMFALAMVMFDRTEEPEILRLAVSSVGALGPYHAQGSYLVDEAGMHSSDGDDRIVAELIELDGADGVVEVPGAEWSWAFPMRAVSGHTGYLVVSADHEPSIDQRFLLTTLAQLTGAALVSAGLHRRERTSTVELGDLNARLESTNEQLAGAVTDLQQRQRIHEVLSSGGGLRRRRGRDSRRGARPHRAGRRGRGPLRQPARLGRPGSPAHLPAPATAESGRAADQGPPQRAGHAAPRSDRGGRPAARRGAGRAQCGRSRPTGGGAGRFRAGARRGRAGHGTGPSACAGRG